MNIKLTSQIEYLKELGEKRRSIGMASNAKAKRDIVAARFDILLPQFIEGLALVGGYGANKYGEYNWMKSRLIGNASPVNHMHIHLNDYEQHKPSEHLEVGEGSKIHLLQIAFNAMMEYYYCLQEEKPLTQIVEEGVDSCDTLSHKTE